MLLVTAACAVFGFGCSSLKDIDLGIPQDLPPEEATVAAGLKEALNVGTERAVVSTSREDGFLGNALIRIALPEELDGMIGTLRDVGMGSVVDDLEVGMNRAAEAASSEAVDIFKDTVQNMTIADAFAILDGGDTAATDYFRERTSAGLTMRFEPIIQAKMAEVGVFNIYQDLVARYNRIPFVEKPEVDLIGYVNEKTLAGLFTVLAQEETRIRKDPLARTTALLQQVFGG
jgi:hypothetical protein